MPVVDSVHLEKFTERFRTKGSCFFSHEKGLNISIHSAFSVSSNSLSWLDNLVQYTATL